MIKCCIFDLDGTILDTINTITYFVNITLERYGISPVTDEECKYFAGCGAKSLIKSALASKNISVSDEKFCEIFNFYKSSYDANPLYLTSVFPGIRELLSELKSSGVRLAVLSNKPDFAVRSIIESFFGGVFDAVRGAVDGVPLKPSASAALEIIKDLSVKPSECAWIGDTKTDVETGKNLGVSLNVGVLWGFRKEDELRLAGADFIAESAEDILKEIRIAR